MLSRSCGLFSCRLLPGHQDIVPVLPYAIRYFHRDLAALTGKAMGELPCRGMTAEFRIVVIRAPARA